MIEGQLPDFIHQHFTCARLQSGNLPRNNGAKEYFNLTLAETAETWPLMEGIVGFAGIAG